MRAAHIQTQASPPSVLQHSWTHLHSNWVQQLTFVFISPWKLIASEEAISCPGGQSCNGSQTSPAHCASPAFEGSGVMWSAWDVLLLFTFREARSDFPHCISSGGGGGVHFWRWSLNALAAFPRGGEGSGGGDCIFWHLAIFVVTAGSLTNLRRTGGLLF